MSRKKRDEENLPVVEIEGIVDINEGAYKPDGNGEYYVYGKVQAQVLTLHFRTGKMRVRYKDNNGKTRTANVSNSPFFSAYFVAER